MEQTDMLTEHAHSEQLALADEWEALKPRPPRRTNRERMAFLDRQCSMHHNDPAYVMGQVAQLRVGLCLSTSEVIDFAMALSGVPVRPWWHWRRWL